MQKHLRQQEYAKQYLSGFMDVTYMFWSPVVPEGYITRELASLSTLKLVINKTYAQYIGELRALAATEMHDSGNIFFRYLQIMERLKKIS